MTKTRNPAQDSRKPALSQAAEERKLRVEAGQEAGREAGRGVPASVLLMGLAGGAVAASGRLPEEKAGPAAQNTQAQTAQDLTLPGAAEGAVSSAEQASAAAQAPVVDGQATGARLQAFNRLMSLALVLTAVWMVAGGAGLNGKVGA